MLVWKRSPKQYQYELLLLKIKYRSHFEWFVFFFVLYITLLEYIELLVPITTRNMEFNDFHMTKNNIFQIILKLVWVVTIYREVGIK